jgi:hypothetical protein
MNNSERLILAVLIASRHGHQCWKHRRSAGRVNLICWRRAARNRCSIGQQALLQGQRSDYAAGIVAVRWAHPIALQVSIQTPGFEDADFAACRLPLKSGLPYKGESLSTLWCEETRGER